MANIFFLSEEFADGKSCSSDCCCTLLCCARSFVELLAWHQLLLLIPLWTSYWGFYIFKFRYLCYFLVCILYSALVYLMRITVDDVLLETILRYKSHRISCLVFLLDFIYLITLSFLFFCWILLLRFTSFVSFLINSPWEDIKYCTDILSFIFTSFVFRYKNTCTFNDIPVWWDSLSRLELQLEISKCCQIKCSAMLALKVSTTHYLFAQNSHKDLFCSGATSENWCLLLIRKRVNVPGNLQKCWWRLTKFRNKYSIKLISN